MTELVRIPQELRPHLIPAQPAYDHDWHYNGPEKEPRSARSEESAGRYDSNNGILCVYDNIGDPYVTSWEVLNHHGITSQQAATALNNAGFRHTGAFVHHSNDGGAFIVRMFPEAYPDMTPACSASESA